MDFLLIATYAALCVAVFKIFRIPLNKWTVPTAVLGGVIIIGTLLLLMNYNHPYSEVVRQYYTTTPIISEVRGRVVDVPVRPHTPLKKGDVLFKIDPEPFEDVIQGIQGELEAAQKDLDRTSELYAKEVASERSVDQTDASVDELQAKLADAQFDLEQTFLRFNQQTIPGRVAVAIKVTDPRLKELRLPGGLFGQAAIYTEHFHHIAVIRKVLLRMAAWMNYVFPLH